MDHKPADMSPVSAAQARRVLALKRAFQRELGHKPTTIQKSLIDRAAVMTAKAEAAALDSTVTANDCVRLDNTANRARAAMFDAFEARPGAERSSSPVPSTADLVRAHMAKVAAQ